MNTQFSKYPKLQNLKPELGWDKLEPIFEEFKVKGGETLFVKYFDGLTTIQRTKLLKGCVRMYRRLIVFRNGKEKWKVQFDEIKKKLLEPCSNESMWKIHSTHQQEIKKYKDEINSLKQKLKGKYEIIKSLKSGVDIQYENRLRKNQEIIDNHKKGYDGLIQRNIDLQNRIFYEEKVNRLLKERIKNFEGLYSGGEVLENIL